MVEWLVAYSAGKTVVWLVAYLVEMTDVSMVEMRAVCSAASKAARKAA